MHNLRYVYYEKYEIIYDFGNSREFRFLVLVFRRLISVGNLETLQSSFWQHLKMNHKNTLHHLPENTVTFLVTAVTLWRFMLMICWVRDQGGSVGIVAGVSAEGGPSGRQSGVEAVTQYELHYRKPIPGRAEMFCSPRRSDWLWGPANLIQGIRGLFFLGMK
jgi:hypothetical protein